MKYLIISIIAVIIILIGLVYFFTLDFCKEIKFSDIQTSCFYKRWGCCKDKITAKLDPEGTNCRVF